MPSPCARTYCDRSPTRPCAPWKWSQVAQQVTHRAGVEVLLRPHAERALGLVVVPGQHVSAALLPERHRQQQHRDGLAGAALRVDHGHLPQAAEVAPHQLDVVPVFLLPPPRPERYHAERALGHHATHAAGGDRVDRPGLPAPGELLGGRRAAVRPARVRRHLGRGPVPQRRRVGRPGTPVMGGAGVSRRRLIVRRRRNRRLPGWAPRTGGARRRLIVRRRGVYGRRRVSGRRRRPGVCRRRRRVWAAAGVRGRGRRWHGVWRVGRWRAVCVRRGCGGR